MMGAPDQGKGARVAEQPHAQSQRTTALCPPTVSLPAHARRTAVPPRTGRAGADRSSIAVTCSIAEWWSLDMIADLAIHLLYLIFRNRRRARTVTEDRQAVGVWLVCMSPLGLEPPQPAR